MQEAARVTEITTEFQRIYDLLASIVGEGYVSTRKAERFLYSRDWTGTTSLLSPVEPDFVVMPKTTEEVQRIVRLANRYNIPLVPQCTNLTSLGVAHSWEGGIRIDLRRMNRILEVNEGDMYAVLEPGVTWGDFAKYIDEHHPEFAHPGCHGPAGAGVVPMYLSWGMPNDGFLTGSAENIQGLEVILPTGELIRTGSAIASPYWFGRLPLLDITGLFVGAMGSTGIITKAAIGIWPKHLKSDIYIAAPNYREGLYQISKKLVRANLGITWFMTVNHACLASFGGQPNSNIPLDPEAAGQPDYHAIITVKAYSEKEMDAKLESLTEIAQAGGAAHISTMEDLLTSFPTENRSILPNVLNEPSQTYTIVQDGGLEYSGTYGPMDTHADFYYACRRLCAEKYNWPIHWFSRFMKGGHYSCIRPCFFSYDRNDPEEVKRVHQMAKDCGRIALEHGAIPYKANPWKMRLIAEKADAGSVEFIRRLQKFLDPKGIMNPGSGRV
nr:FAD-binding oxidoreductase [Desulfobacterales bacterium]